LRVRFWGTRGSIAAPGPATTRFGGNTSCVEVRSDDETLVVLDCGTGARALGLHLLQARPAPLRLNLFIGHTHWDHIQGFPFFVPAFLPDAELNVYAPTGFQRGLEEALAGQMEYSYFPVKLRELRSRLHFTEIDEGFFRVGDMLVETQYLNHTAPTIGYRITGDGATVAYVTDHEPFWPEGSPSQHPGDQGHVAFLRGADLVIHDAQYSEDEYRERVGWGHSTPQYAVDVAVAAGARRLALFHHDPGHDDEAISAMQEGARRRADGRLDVFAAGEGVEMELRGGDAGVPHAEVSALRRRPVAGSRILLVSSEPADVAAIEEMLTADDLAVFTVPDMQAALARGREIAPDLVIIDGHLPDGNSASLVRPLLERLDRPNVPTVLLAEAIAPSAGMGEAFDYLAKPFSPPTGRRWPAPGGAASGGPHEPRCRRRSRVVAAGRVDRLPTVPAAHHSGAGKAGRGGH
jgi:phosphoribosyl 1,2-cyclic phosphodiesterase